MTGLDLHLAALVLLAAAMHAVWNALVKKSTERVLTLATVIATALVVCVPAAFMIEPPNREAWPFLAASGVVHHVYYAGLVYGYRHGDLGQFYPIARGTGPLLVATFGFLVLDERLGVAGGVGVATICLGVFLLARTGAPQESRKALGLALGTGVVIATYTLSDGMGVRASDSKVSYIVWSHIVSGTPFPIVVAWVQRKRLAAFARTEAPRALIGGSLAFVAYAIAIWAMSRSGLAYVAALRETSVVIAAFLGARFLGESFGGRRIAAATLVAIGVIVVSSV